MYQITELQAAVANLEGQIAGLSVTVEWAVEGFTIDYIVDFRGHPIHSREPIPVRDAPRQVADALRTALVELLPNPDLETLIKTVEDTSVSLF